MQMSKGDDYNVNKDDIATTGIHLGEHYNAIEIHRSTLTEAKLLRDTILNSLKPKEPVLASSNIVCTPANIEEIQSFVKSIPKEHQGIAYIAIQMTINYINSKE